MTQATGKIRSNEQRAEDARPARTRDASHIESACTSEGTGDFDPDDLNSARHRFPDRHTTPDGDAITA